MEFLIEKVLTNDGKKSMLSVKEIWRYITI